MDITEFYSRLQYNLESVIIEVWAPWCAPCRAMQADLTRVQEEFAGKVDLIKINADESTDLVNQLKVMGIPTLIGYSRGKEIIRKTGKQSVVALQTIFNAVFLGEKNAIIPPAPVDRWLRFGSGIILLFASFIFERSFFLMGLGSLLIFSAFYDRCPIYRAIRYKLKSIFSR